MISFGSRLHSTILDNFRFSFRPHIQYTIIKTYMFACSHPVRVRLLHSSIIAGLLRPPPPVRWPPKPVRRRPSPSSRRPPGPSACATGRSDGAVRPACPTSDAARCRKPCSRAPPCRSVPMFRCDRNQPRSRPVALSVMGRHADKSKEGEKRVHHRTHTHRHTRGMVGGGGGQRGWLTGLMCSVDGQHLHRQRHNTHTLSLIHGLILLVVVFVCSVLLVIIINRKQYSYILGFV